MAAHGRSIAVAKSWIAAASRLGRSVVSWERRVRHGRRKAVTTGAAGARSRLRKSQSNLPLGFTEYSPVRYGFFAQNLASDRPRKLSRHTTTQQQQRNAQHTRAQPPGARLPAAVPAVSPPHHAATTPHPSKWLSTSLLPRMQLSTASLLPPSTESVSASTQSLPRRAFSPDPPLGRLSASLPRYLLPRMQLSGLAARLDRRVQSSRKWQITPDSSNYT
jgi:hypothetical protein